jgi:hypothetical protein
LQRTSHAFSITQPSRITPRSAPSHLLHVISPCTFSYSHHICQLTLTNTNHRQTKDEHGPWHAACFGLLSSGELSWPWRVCTHALTIHTRDLYALAMYKLGGCVVVLAHRRGQTNLIFPLSHARARSHVQPHELLAPRHHLPLAWQSSACLS